MALVTFRKLHSRCCLELKKGSQKRNLTWENLVLHHGLISSRQLHQDWLYCCLVAVMKLFLFHTVRNSWKVDLIFFYLYWEFLWSLYCSVFYFTDAVNGPHWKKKHFQAKLRFLNLDVTVRAAQISRQVWHHVRKLESVNSSCSTEIY